MIIGFCYQTKSEVEGDLKYNVLSSIEHVLLKLCNPSTVSVIITRLRQSEG